MFNWILQLTPPQAIGLIIVLVIVLGFIYRIVDRLAPKRERASKKK